MSPGLSETGRTPPGRGRAVTGRRRRTSSKLTNSDILILHFEFGTVQYSAVHNILTFGDCITGGRLAKKELKFSSVCDIVL